MCKVYYNDTIFHLWPENFTHELDLSISSVFGDPVWWMPQWDKMWLKEKTAACTEDAVSLLIKDAETNL